MDIKLKQFLDQWRIQRAIVECVDDHSNENTEKYDLVKLTLHKENSNRPISIEEREKITKETTPPDVSGPDVSGPVVSGPDVSRENSKSLKNQ